jgi:primosomal protein N' (replication factor Y) (superfamily II helicase)
MFDSERFPPSFATVVVTISIGPLERLTYGIPEKFRSRLRSGMRVVVPVGRRKTTGIVIHTGSACNLPDSSKIKEILELMDDSPIFPPDLLNLWDWSTKYYLTSLGEMLRTILPGGLKSESVQIVKLKKEPGLNKPQAGKESHESWSTRLAACLTPAERETLALLEAKKRMPLKTLRRHSATLSLRGVLQKLEALGAVEISEHLPRRKTLPALGEAKAATCEGRPLPFSLSAAQKDAGGQIVEALHTSAFHVFLLHGVTGSGKTEIYLQAAQETINRGKSVLILVPEIGLTHQLIERAHERFGTQVAVLHSALVASQRWAEWWRIARGEATVVIGVRSAVFAPLPSLGLIVVDEEHDTAYKQEEGVRYNARDLAVVRGKIASCPVILGSATPSLESYTHSRAQRYKLLALSERVEARPLPLVEIVDLRQEARAGDQTKIFSAALRQALVTNHQAGKQSLLFLNRRGYANYLQCRLCGEVLSCPHCSVTLKFHLRSSVLCCHYCGFSRQAPDSCPQCRQLALARHGFGTEQVEEALRSFLPEARIGRLDRDNVSQRNALERLLTAWRTHDIDILIGTQMVAKGHDVPDVTLVGVLLADVSLNLPDFRAAERTFQLLTQVAGRAGRGLEPGRVIIQTYAPEHYSIRCAAHHDFARFANYELRYRKRLGYPPFTRAVNIRFEGKDEEKVQAYAEKVAHYLLAHAQGENEPTVVLGPAPAPIERIRGRERWQVLLKSKDRHTLLALVKKTQAELFTHQHTNGIRVIVDVDPYSML